MSKTNYKEQTFTYNARGTIVGTQIDVKQHSSLDNFHNLSMSGSFWQICKQDSTLCKFGELLARCAVLLLRPIISILFLIIVVVVVIIWCIGMFLMRMSLISVLKTLGIGSFLKSSSWRIVPVVSTKSEALSIWLWYTRLWWRGEEGLVYARIIGCGSVFVVRTVVIDQNLAWVSAAYRHAEWLDSQQESLLQYHLCRGSSWGWLRSSLASIHTSLKCSAMSHTVLSWYFQLSPLSASDLPFQSILSHQAFMLQLGDRNKMSRQWRNYITGMLRAQLDRVQELVVELGGTYKLGSGWSQY